MTKARRTFYIFLAIVLAILAASISSNLINSGAMQSLYIASAIFSIGIVSLDFLGILGEDNSDADSGDYSSGDLDAGDFDGASLGDADSDAGGIGGVDFDAGFDFDGDGSIDLSADDGTGAGVDLEGTGFEHTDTSKGTHAGHLGEMDSVAGYRVLQILSYLRLTVYFCLGFGPTGWMAMTTERAPLISLAWAILAGAISLTLAQWFFRFQNSNTDSSVTKQDLLREEAIVTIALTDSTMGKVRIKTGMSVLEQYALSSTPGQEFKRGDVVHVTRVTDECVYVA